MKVREYHKIPKGRNVIVNEKVMNGEFILGDCMDYLPKYDDNHFDLTIVDPPYKNIFRNMHIVNKGNLTPTKKYGYSSLNNLKPDQVYFDELKRISKHQIIFGCQYFIEFLKNTNCFIIWDKCIDGLYSDAEIAWTSFNSATRIFVFKWAGMLQQNMKNKEHRIHPTQKPVALYKWLLHNYAKEGDLILDTHVGSASSLIACEDMGFNYVGFELDKNYYEAATNRLQNHIANLTIKFPAPEKPQNTTLKIFE